MDEAERTDAQRNCADGRLGELDELRESLARAREIGDKVAEDALSRVLAAWTADGDPIAGSFEVTREVLVEAMADLGVDSGVLNCIELTETSLDSITARVRGFPDGSACVRVSRALFSLSHLYARHAARHLIGVSRLADRAHAMSTLGVLDLDLLVGSLRYHAVHQRVFGMASKITLLLDPSQESLASLLSLHTLRFVVAHEFAHHVLGHTETERGFAPNADVSGCSDEQRRETEADELALAAVVGAAEKDPVPEPWHAILGAALAIAAIESAERSLYVRTGRTHPPAAARGDLLLRLLPQETDQTLRRITTGLRTATATASGFAPGVQPEWVSIFAHPEIHTPHDKSYQRAVARFDEMMCTDSATLAQWLRTWSERFDIPLTPGIDAAVAGYDEDAMVAWGIPDRHITQFTNRSSALSFHALQNQVFTRLPAPDLTVTQRRILSVCASSLVARTLTEEDPA